EERKRLLVHGDDDLSVHDCRTQVGLQTRQELRGTASRAAIEPGHQLGRVAYLVQWRTERLCDAFERPAGEQREMAAPASDRGRVRTGAPPRGRGAEELGGVG